MAGAGSLRVRTAGGWGDKRASSARPHLLLPILALGVGARLC